MFIKDRRIYRGPDGDFRYYLAVGNEHSEESVVFLWDGAKWAVTDLFDMADDMARLMNSRNRWEPDHDVEMPVEHLSVRAEDGPEEAIETTIGVVQGDVIVGNLVVREVGKTIVGRILGCR